MHRRSMAAAGALLFLFCVCFMPLAVHAEGAGDIFVQSVDIDDTDLRFLPLGGNPAALDLPKKATAFYYEGGKRKGEPCDIRWLTDDLLPSAPGRQILVGEVVLPDGFAFASEALKVSIPVLVYDPAGAPTEWVVACSYADGPNAIIPLGAGRDALAGCFTHLWPEAYVTTEAGDSFFCPVTLDLDAIVPTTAGAYYPIAFELPGGVGMTDVFAYYALSVHVVPTDAVDLGAVGLYESSYRVQWLYAAQNPVLWVSVDEGEWSVSETPDMPLYNSYGRFVGDDAGITDLDLHYANLADGHLYKFQVQYDGDRFSNVLVLDLVNNSLPRVSGEQGGDRTGGDREEGPPLGGGITLPPWENTPPESIVTPTPAPSPTPQKAKRQSNKPAAPPSATPAVSPAPAPSAPAPQRTEESDEAIAAMRQPPNTPSPPSITVVDGHEGQEQYADSWLPVLLTGLIGLAAAAAFLLWMHKKGGRRHEV